MENREMYNKKIRNLIGSRYPGGVNVLTAGYALCDSDFSGEVINPPYSRLYFILGGTLIIKPRCEEGDVLRLERGGAYILPKGYSFDYFSEGELSHLYFHITMLDGGVDVLSRLSRPMCVQRGSERIEELRSLCERDDKISELFAARRLLHTIELLISEANLSGQRTKVLTEAAEVAKIIDSAPRIGITLGYLADMLHISERTLTRKFRLSFGMSVGEYIESRVMELAERELLAGELSISEISEKYGFCDRFYFSRKFKKYFGKSPSSYKALEIV